MVVSVLLLLFGVPVIVWLTLLAARRVRALTRRIAEVRRRWRAARSRRMQPSPT